MKHVYSFPMALIASAAMFIACSDDATVTHVESYESQHDHSFEVNTGSSETINMSSETQITSSETIVASSADVVTSSSSVAGPVTYSYYGAELSGRDQFKYGRFEARMKIGRAHV